MYPPILPGFSFALLRSDLAKAKGDGEHRRQAAAAAKDALLQQHARASAALEAKAAMEAINLDEAEAVADVKAAVAAQVTAVPRATGALPTLASQMPLPFRGRSSPCPTALRGPGP